MNSRPVRASLRSLFALLAIGLAPFVPAGAAEVRVAVASNFQKPMEALAQPFRDATGHGLKLSFGSTGSLYSQIVNGAPFDVLLAADAETPERLERERKAVASTRIAYAIGRLALWSVDPAAITGDGADVLSRGRYRRLAIADPALAPYGAAALQVLGRLDLVAAVRPKLVTGQNIAQALQFAETGNAELAFVALSQVVDPQLAGRGSHWPVPAALHDPIVQSAVLLLSGVDPAPARALIGFLTSPAAQAVIATFGYGVPASVP